MSEPFVGEIKMFAGNFAPRGWAFCDGQLLAVSQNDALFSLLGTIYGGDGRTTFGLPDLRGRLAIHQGTGPGLSPRRLGSKSGLEQEILTINTMPSHKHGITGSVTVGSNTTVANTNEPSGNVFGAGENIFNNNPAEAGEELGGVAVNLSMSNNGGSREHTNLQPTLCINYIIALVGIYPSRQ